MCTLTYRLTKSGYDLFFNRDEQRSRAQALSPQVNEQLNAIYPIDPLGKGTWLAVHQSGLSLALLNYYQAGKEIAVGDFRSRGEIILTLLKSAGNALETLKAMSLTCYQPFQLCIFAPDLSLQSNKPLFLQWDGESLTERQQVLPITSSAIDYPDVYQARKLTFQQMVNTTRPSIKELMNFHKSQQDDGKLSVKMFRLDAKTVSFSHIQVGKQIEFHYLDYLNDQQDVSVLTRMT